MCVCDCMCVDVMRSEWCSSVPVGRAPSFREFSGGNSAGERRGTAVPYTYTKTSTDNTLLHICTHIHHSLPRMPTSHTLIYFFQPRQGKWPRCTTAMNGTSVLWRTFKKETREWNFHLSVIEFNLFFFFCCCQEYLIMDKWKSPVLPI